MKQIYLFNEESRASVYGIGTYIRQLIACLKNREDISLNVVLLNSEEKEFAKVTKDGYTLYYFPFAETSVYEDKYYRNIGFLWMTNIQIVPDEPLIFHFNYTWEYPFIQFLKENYPAANLLFTIHYQKWSFSLRGNAGCLRDVLSMRNKCLEEEDKKILLTDLEEETRLYLSVDKLICLSRFTKNILNEVYKIPEEKIALVYNGMEDEVSRMPLSATADLRRKFFFNETDKILVYVGRLDEIKGLSCIIEAFKKVAEVCPEGRLAIVGDGDFGKYLKACAPYWNKITFTGFLDKENLYALYSLADAGIMLSFHEQCSYVAIEMMMFGLPVVSTDSTGLDEMFPDSLLKLRVHYEDKNAFLSVDECKEKILQAFQCPESVRQTNRKLYLEKYTLEKMTEGMDGLYV